VLHSLQLCAAAHDRVRGRVREDLLDAGRARGLSTIPWTGAFSTTTQSVRLCHHTVCTESLYCRMVAGSPTCIIQWPQDITTSR
jgi:hypothetical protein